MYFEKAFTGLDFVGWTAFLKILAQEDPTPSNDPLRAQLIKTKLIE